MAEPHCNPASKPARLTKLEIHCAACSQCFAYFMDALLDDPGASPCPTGKAMLPSTPPIGAMLIPPPAESWIDYEVRLRG